MNDIRQSRLFVVDIDGKNRREIPVTLRSRNDGRRLLVARRIAAGAQPDRTRAQRRVRSPSSISTARTSESFPFHPAAGTSIVCDWNTLTPGLKVGARDETLDLKTPRGRYQALLQEIKKDEAVPAPKVSRPVSRDRRLGPERPGGHRRADLGGHSLASTGPSSPARSIGSLQNHADRRKVGHAALSFG